MHCAIIKVKRSNSKIDRSVFKKYAEIINNKVGKNYYLTVKSSANS